MFSQSPLKRVKSLPVSDNPWFMTSQGGEGKFRLELRMLSSHVRRQCKLQMEAVIPQAAAQRWMGPKMPPHPVEYWFGY